MPDAGDKKISGDARKSRLETLRDAWVKAEKGRHSDDYAPDMPPIDARYLIDYLYEVGPTVGGPMGECPLTHAELRAWQDNVGIEVQPWEARFLRRLSIEYLTQAQAATKPQCPPPYGLLASRARVAKKIDEVFG